MRKNRISISLPLCLFFIAIICFTSSCISNKNVVYFNNLPDTTLYLLDKLQPPTPKLQVNDLIEISVGGENEQTVQYIQTYITGGTSLQAIVDLEGNIELPKVGKIHVEGLTRDDLKDTLTNVYKEYLLDPLIRVKFGNFHFTVLGEVKTPGSFDLTADKVSILEALGRAGDMTPYSERKKVKIIREVNGEREILSLDLTDKDVLNSPNYYINRYDIIYVTAKEIKQTNENFQRITPYIGIVTSLFTLIFLFTRK